MFLARKKIDLLVINSSVPLGAILLAAASRRPTVIIVREFVFPEWLSTGLLRLIDLVARRVITVSDALKLDIERKTGSRKVTRIFGGIDVGTFEYSPPRETVRRVGPLEASTLSKVRSTWCGRSPALIYVGHTPRSITRS